MPRVTGQSSSWRPSLLREILQIVAVPGICTSGALFELTSRD